MLENGGIAVKLGVGKIFLGHSGVVLMTEELTELCLYRRMCEAYGEFSKL